MARGIRRRTSRITARLLAVLPGLSARGLPIESYAATQGVVGSTSGGSLHISVFLGSGLIIIKGLDDIDLGTWSGTGDLVGASLHCVGTNAPANRFRVAATGTGAGAAFTLSNGAGTLPYSVSYDDGTGFAQMTPGTYLPNRKGIALAAASNCQTSGNPLEARQVRIPEANLAVAPAGIYASVLTMTVAPEQELPDSPTQREGRVKVRASIDAPSVPQKWRQTLGAKGAAPRRDQALSRDW